VADAVPQPTGQEKASWHFRHPSFLPPNCLHGSLSAVTMAAPFRDSVNSSMRQSYDSLPLGAQTPQWAGNTEYNSSAHALQEMTPYHDDPTRAAHYSTYSSAPVPGSPTLGEHAELEGKRTLYDSPRSKSKRNVILMAVGSLLAIILAVVLLVYFLAIKPKNSSGQSSSSQSTSSATRTATSAKPSATAKPITGGDGSIVTMEDGTTFTYRNSFGGFWVDDPNDPFNNGARPQSWSPGLNETFRYGIDQIRGCVLSMNASDLSPNVQIV